MYEQADTGKDGFIYSWILEAPYKARKQLDGWKWVRGKPGCYVTNSNQLANATADRLHLKIVSNGTHKAINAPMFGSCEYHSCTLR